MLEGLAAWVLRTYVGEYVENLNTDQLSIGYGRYSKLHKCDTYTSRPRLNICKSKFVVFSC